ncbi:MAG TPA: hypothetical protein VGM19_01895 [Armatimonadota bacterium]|jgi:hypothetical protein
MNRVTPILLALLLAAAAAADEPAPRPQVTLRAAATASSGDLTLAQVAEIVADPAVRERLAAVSLGPAPLPSGLRLLTRGYLRLRLRCAGFDPDQLTLSGAEQVTVSAPAPARPPTAAAPVAPAADLPPGSPAAPAPPPVRLDWGAAVTVVACCGLIEVRATGQIQGRPTVGETVKVRLAGSNAVVEGLLLSTSLVEVSSLS